MVAPASVNLSPAMAELLNKQGAEMGLTENKRLLSKPKSGMNMNSLSARLLSHIMGLKDIYKRRYQSWRRKLKRLF